MSKINDLTGKRFGRLTVIKYYGSNKKGKSLWLCKCKCGNNKIVLGNSLVTNLTKSCGCYNKEHSKKYIQRIICHIVNCTKYGKG